MSILEGYANPPRTSIKVELTHANYGSRQLVRGPKRLNSQKVQLRDLRPDRLYVSRFNCPRGACLANHTFPSLVLINGHTFLRKKCVRLAFLKDAPTEQSKRKVNSRSAREPIWHIKKSETVPRLRCSELYDAPYPRNPLFAYSNFTFLMFRRHRTQPAHGN